MTKVLLTRITSTREDEAPTIVGNTASYPPEVGHHFFIIKKGEDPYDDNAETLRTTPIKEVRKAELYDGYIFVTRNSTYRVEKVE